MATIITHSRFVQAAFVSSLVWQTFGQMMLGRLSFSWNKVFSRWHAVKIHGPQMVRDQKEFGNRWNKDTASALSFSRAAKDSSCRRMHGLCIETFAFGRRANDLTDLMIILFCLVALNEISWFACNAFFFLCCPRRQSGATDERHELPAHRGNWKWPKGVR